jgi:hypothetical protein
MMGENSFDELRESERRGNVCGPLFESLIHIELGFTGSENILTRNTVAVKIGVIKLFTYRYISNI